MARPQRRDGGGDQCAERSAEQDAGRDVAHDLPVHRAVLVMFAQAGDAR